MADAIAGYFGDEPHVVRVLTGLEAIPPGQEARGLADRIMALSELDRAFVTRIVEALGTVRGKPRRR